MRFEQLEYLATVMRLGSLRRAAEELHLSQPALSETLRNLERELGVSLLERKREGTRLSEEGRDLLPHIMEVLEAVDRLNRAADQRRRNSLAVRVGTVNAATVPVLAPAIQAFRYRNPATSVTVIPARPDEIRQALLEGAMDLGLVNLLAGDEPAAELEATRLIEGRVVVCMRPDNPLADRTCVTPEDLVPEPLIVMRSGYLMHRFVRRLFAGQLPAHEFTMDGAEMGKLMVAEGLGVTLLPDYSVAGDPMERRGDIITRPLAVSGTGVLLYLQHRPAAGLSRSVRALRDALVTRAAQYAEERHAEERHAQEQPAEEQEEPATAG